ncbi:hypothetical protein B0H67DRAFT_26485 [Lasiosphaeris hirsuta]|uniref:Uncharacterized protein n=1 Tax=Lasiosphaeris hirsuta TaxID=260670 RepID=A0AA40B9U2_9PEZI|nr:hypothetical protein B0H67DRAFT_26485 [Lasiosphaeris hirsuta]
MQTRAVLFLAGLAAGLVIPKVEAWQVMVMDHWQYGTQACHSVLTSCRLSVDCCPDLLCRAFDGESLCTPGG